MQDVSGHSITKAGTLWNAENEFFFQRYQTRCGQEPSSGSCLKRSNLEAIRRADAEAEKALKHAKVLEERPAAKRQSATPMEESATNPEVTAESLMIAAELVWTETRETVEVFTVSALQQAHEMSHRLR